MPSLLNNNDTNNTQAGVNATAIATSVTNVTSTLSTSTHFINKPPKIKKEQRSLGDCDGGAWQALQQTVAELAFSRATSGKYLSNVMAATPTSITLRGEKTTVMNGEQYAGMINFGLETNARLLAKINNPRPVTDNAIPNNTNVDTGGPVTGGNGRGIVQVSGGANAVSVTMSNPRIFIDTTFTCNQNQPRSLKR